LIVHTS